MPGRPRHPALASDSGVIGVGTVIGVALVALCVYLLVAAFEGDPDYFGSVPIPSNDEPIVLDSGEVEVSYAEDVDPDALVPPDGLSYSIRAGDGEVLQASSRSGGAKDSDLGAVRTVSAVDVPDDGIYFVTVESGEAGARAAPALALGLSPVGAIEKRWNDVVDELNGPTGIVFGVALLILFLIPRVERTIKQRRRDRQVLY